MDEPTRVAVNVVTTSRQAAVVEFRVRMETVEVWSWHHLSGIFERHRLQVWLTNPVRWLAEGEVVLSVDPRSGGDRIAVTLPDVLTWTLSPQEQAQLTETVCTEKGAGRSLG